MPLVVGHALLGSGVVVALDLHPRKRELLLGAALAVFPDLDLFFTWILGLGISWHGGFTHSIVAAVLVGWLCSRYCGSGSIRQAVAFSTAMASHGLLDVVTKKTYGGAQLLWPFSFNRYKLGLFDYFAFYPDSGLDPAWKLIRRALEISLYELLLFGSIFLLIGWVRRLIAARRLQQQEETEVRLWTSD